MLIWQYDYFCSQKSHLLVMSTCSFGGMITLPAKITSTHLQVEQVDVILAGKDIAIVFWCKMGCTEFPHFFWNSEF
jgi:hypothetical protein